MRACGCLNLGLGVGKFDAVLRRVDGEKEVALLDDIAVLETNAGQRATDLGAQFDATTTAAELAEELKLGFNVLNNRRADNYRRRGRSGRSRLG